MTIPLPFGFYFDIWRAWGRIDAAGRPAGEWTLHASIRRRKSHRTLWTRRLR